MVVSMSREDDFLKIIHENYVNQQKPKKEWEILRDRIMSDNISDEYWWGLKEDVDAFFKSKASKEDKKRLAGYVEHLLMVLDWTKRGIDDILN